MKKKSLLCLLLTICIVGVTACKSSSDSSAPAKTQESTSDENDSEEKIQQSEPEEAQENTSATENDNVVESADTDTNELSKSDQEEYDLINKYFDAAEYIENDRKIEENKLDMVLSSMTVDNTKLELGMSYNDILSLGYKPENESFAEETPKELNVTCEFINDKGNSIHLGFASSDKTSTVGDGGCLYEIAAYPERNTFTFDKISETSTISDIINAIGNPYRIDVGYYSDFPDMKMEYVSKEYSQYLTFYVNLKTGKIVSVHLEGYTE